METLFRAILSASLAKQYQEVADLFDQHVSKNTYNATDIKMIANMGGRVAEAHFFLGNPLQEIAYRKMVYELINDNPDLFLETFRILSIRLLSECYCRHSLPKEVLPILIAYQDKYPFAPLVDFHLAHVRRAVEGTAIPQAFDLVINKTLDTNMISFDSWIVVSVAKTLGHRESQVTKYWISLMKSTLETFDIKTNHYHNRLVFDEDHPIDFGILLCHTKALARTVPLFNKTLLLCLNELICQASSRCWFTACRTLIHHAQAIAQVITTTVLSSSTYRNLSQYLDKSMSKDQVCPFDVTIVLKCCNIECPEVNTGGVFGRCEICAGVLYCSNRCLDRDRQRHRLDCLAYSKTLGHKVQADLAEFVWNDQPEEVLTYVGKLEPDQISPDLYIYSCLSASKAAFLVNRFPEELQYLRLAYDSLTDQTEGHRLRILVNLSEIYCRGGMYRSALELLDNNEMTRPTLQVRHHYASKLSGGSRLLDPTTEAHLKRGIDDALDREWLLLDFWLYAAEAIDLGYRVDDINRFVEKLLLKSTDSSFSPANIFITRTKRQMGEVAILKTIGDIFHFLKGRQWSGKGLVPTFINHCIQSMIPKQMTIPKFVSL